MFSVPNIHNFYTQTFIGAIQSLEGVVSRRASLVNTEPEISSTAALRKLQEEWNHNRNDTSLSFREDKAELLILQNVSYNKCLDLEL